MREKASMATPRFLDALDYAVRLHGDDLRKGTQIPYTAHLLGACALVLADGGTEDEAIAALLHDALEDHPTEARREIIAERFGNEVLSIIEACTNTPPEPGDIQRTSWRQWKAAYVRRFATAPASVLRVALADKLDNARSIVVDYRNLGEALWQRFSAGRDDYLWYYRSQVQAFLAAGASGYLMEEFERTVAELEKLAEGRER